MVKLPIARIDYFKALNLDQDPFNTSYTAKLFFTTPELQHRLDLIKHLLEFSQQILFVKGVPKVGKSFICKHLVEHADETWAVCQIEANDEIGPDTLVKALLHEYKDVIDDTSETISALNSYMAHCNLNSKVPILFIDNADNLNQTSLRFILQLMEFKEQDTFIRVVLIGQDSFLDRLNDVSEEKSNTNMIHSVTIPLLSLEQTIDYLRHRVSVCGGRVDMFSEKEMSRIYKVAAGVPGDINFLARQGLSDPVDLTLDAPLATVSKNKKSKTGQIIKIMLAAMLVTSIVLSLFLYERENKQVDPKTLSVNLPPQLQQPPVPMTDKIETREPEALPDAWLESQVIVEPEFVSEEPISSSDAEEKLELEADRIIIDSNEALEKLPIVIAEAEQKRQVQETDKPELSAEKMMSNDWLLAQSASSYVLQLMGAVEMATISRFMQEAQLDQSQLAIYKVQKSNTEWHVLVYGLYADIQQARTAIDTLPVKAQAQKPWPKAMSSIHEAIKAP